MERVWRETVRWRAAQLASEVWFVATICTYPTTTSPRSASDRSQSSTRGVVRRRAAGRVGINKASLKASANATAKHTRAIFAELDGSEDLYLDAIKIGGLSAKLPHLKSGGGFA